MAPQDNKNINLLDEYKEPMMEQTKEMKKSRIVWKNVIAFIIFHTGALYGIYLTLFFKLKFFTFAFVYCLLYASALGTTAGSHRLWTHRAYKARLPLQILLLILQTISLQGPVILWVRDHRMHHKYSETDADPHNSKRGFFFSHIGWLLVRKHPDIKAKAHTIDLSDVLNDPLLTFQKRYYAILTPIAALIIPSYIPTLWGESLLNGFVICAFTRCVLVWHFTYLVNSWAHLYGNRPYDKNINPVESYMVSYFTAGEGFHNYHHIFPWDYKASEINNITYNLTKHFIELMAKIGWAYDLKTVSPDVVRKRVERTGDGSHTVWGWTDKNMPSDDRKAAIIMNSVKDCNLHTLSL